jgi:hypothetical protein
MKLIITTIFHALIGSLAIQQAVGAEDLFRLLVAENYVQHPATVVELSSTSVSNLLSSRDEAITLPLELPEFGKVVFEGKRIWVTDANTSWYAQSNVTRTAVPIPAYAAFRGELRGIPKSSVSLTVFRTWAIGYVEMPTNMGVVRYSIAPFRTTPHSPIIICDQQYTTAPAPWKCNTDESVVNEKQPREKHSERSQSLERVRLAVECDEPYYIDHGRDITRANEYLIAVIASVSEIFQRDVDATVYLGDVTIFTTTDPYPGTESDVLLTQFQTNWRNNRTTVQRTIAHLFSGINGIGGIAFVDVLCSTSRGYAVSGLDNRYTYPTTSYTWDIDVTAHELGHNVGSLHTHNCSWNPPIDSCVAAEGTCYNGSIPRQGTIMSYCHLTPQGKTLDFHPRCITVMRNELAAATCVATTNDLVISTLQDTTICAGTSYVIPASISSGSAPYTITWTPNTAIQNATQIQPTVSPTTTTVYSVEVRDQFNAVARRSVRIAIFPPVTVSVPDTVFICFGLQQTITASVASGAAPFMYRWYVDGIQQTEPSTRFSVESNRPQTVVVEVIDANGCVGKDSTMVRIFTPPVAEIVAPPVVCPGQNSVLSATISGGKPPYGFQWLAQQSPFALCFAHCIKLLPLIIMVVPTPPWQL